MTENTNENEETIESLIKKIEDLQYQMYASEISDDFYYTRGNYKYDAQCLASLESQLKEMKDKENA